MTRKSNFLLLYLYVPIVVLCVLGAFGGVSAGADDRLKLTILHVNDTHAHYLPYKVAGKEAPVGGMAKTATVLNDIRSEKAQSGSAVLTLHAGDLLTGTPFSTVYKGELGIELMNRMGFEAMVVGNHEFDEGSKNLLENLKPAAQFPIMSANIRREDGAYPFPRSLTRTYPGTDTRVIVFGLTTTATPTSAYPPYTRGFVFENAIETAKKVLESARPEDLVIALTHLGVNHDVELAKAVPLIDVVVGGHSHTALEEPLRAGSALVVQAGAYARYAGRLDLDVVNGEVTDYSGRLIPLDPEIKEDPTIAALIETYKNKMDTRFNEVIGRTDVFLDGRLIHVRSNQSTNLGTLIARLLAESGNAEAGIMNGGGIRSSIPQGDVTLGQVYSVLPFSNHVVTVKLSGSDLQSIIRRSHDLELGSGGKLQTWGIKTEKDGDTVKIARVGSRPFSPDEQYTVATNNFLVAGGDGYETFKKDPVETSTYRRALSHVLAAFIKQQGPVTEELMARLTAEPKEKGKEAE